MKLFNVHKFYNDLNVIRQYKGCKWSDVAREAGVSQSTLSQMQRGGKPNADSLVALLHWSKMDIKDLIMDVPEAEELQESTRLLEFDNVSRETMGSSVDVEEAEG